jgi:putative FmdB family regulatory protein
MPLYEYQCTQCGKKTEVLQRFADAPLAACPTCGGAVKKLISSPAFQFKGSGWYVTDYARKGGAGSTGEAAGGADGGAVSKPEAKTGSQPDSRSATSEGRSEKSESRSEKSEGRAERSEGRAERSESRSERSDSRSESKADSKSDSKSESKSDSRAGAKGDPKPAAAGTGSGGS